MKIYNQINTDYIKKLYNDEVERISVDDKLKPNYEALNNEIYNKILLINPKLNDDNKDLIIEFIEAISNNALEEGQIDQSALFATMLLNPNIIKKYGNEYITKRLKKRRVKFEAETGL